jgi:hypothetical protein
MSEKRSAFFIGHVCGDFAACLDLSEAVAVVSSSAVHEVKPWFATKGLASIIIRARVDRELAVGGPLVTEAKLRHPQSHAA